MTFQGRIWQRWHWHGAVDWNPHAVVHINPKGRDWSGVVDRVLAQLGESALP